MKPIVLTQAFILLTLITTAQITQVHQENGDMWYNYLSEDEMIFYAHSGNTITIYDESFNVIEQFIVSKTGHQLMNARKVTRTLFDTDNQFEVILNWEDTTAATYTTRHEIVESNGNVIKTIPEDFSISGIINGKNDTYMLARSSNPFQTKVYTLPGNVYQPQDTTSTGLPSIEKAKSETFNSYPNPTSNKATIQLNQNSNSNQIDIYNVNEKHMDSRSLDSEQKKVIEYPI